MFWSRNQARLWRHDAIFNLLMTHLVGQDKSLNSVLWERLMWVMNKEQGWKVLCKLRGTTCLLKFRKVWDFPLLNSESLELLCFRQFPGREGSNIFLGNSPNQKSPPGNQSIFKCPYGPWRPQSAGPSRPCPEQDSLLEVHATIDKTLLSPPDKLNLLKKQLDLNNFQKK